MSGGSGGAKSGLARREAARAAGGLERAREAAAQLSLLAAGEAEAEAPVAAGPKGGRPKGSKNRVKSDLRKLMAARGHRMPEDVLAGLAGLDSRADPLELALARAEVLMDWAGGPSGAEAAAWKAGDRLAVAMQVLREMRQAGEALLPYGLAKVTPDQGGGSAVFITLPAAQAAASGAVIEGAARPEAGLYAPPPRLAEIVRNQAVAEDADCASDDE